MQWYHDKSRPVSLRAAGSGSLNLKPESWQPQDPRQGQVILILQAEHLDEGACTQQPLGDQARGRRGHDPVRHPWVVAGPPILWLSQGSRMQALVIMSLLTQLVVCQPKFLLSLSHWKARLPGDEARVPNKMRSPENSLWSRCRRRNPVLVIHRVLTINLGQPVANEQVTSEIPIARNRNFR